MKSCGSPFRPARAWGARRACCRPRGCPWSRWQPGGPPPCSSQSGLPPHLEGEEFINLILGGAVNCKLSCFVQGVLNWWYWFLGVILSILFNCHCKWMFLTQTGYQWKAFYMKVLIPNTSMKECYGLVQYLNICRLKCRLIFIHCVPWKWSNNEIACFQ